MLNMSIRFRLVMGMAIVGLVAVTLGAVYLSYDIDDKVEKVTQQRQQVLQNLITNEINQKLLVVTSNAFAISLNEGIGEALANNDRNAAISTVTKIGEGYRKFSDYRNVKMHVHTAAKKSFLRSWKPDDHGDDLSAYRLTLNEVAKTGKQLSAIEVGRVGLVLRGISPVFHQGNFVGSLEVIAGTGSVSRKFAEQGIDYVQLITRDATSIAKAAANNMAIGPYRLVNDKWFSDQAKAFAKTADFKLLETQGYQITDTHFLTLVPVEDFSGKVVGYHLIGEDRAKLFATIDQTRHDGMLYLMMFGITILIILLLVYLLLHTYVTQPIKKLVNKLDSFGRDLTLRLPVIRQDEIGALTQHFNAFIENVEQAVKQVKQADMTVHNAIQQVEFKVNETTERIRNQDADLQHASHSIQQMSQAIGDISVSAQSAAQAAATADIAAKDGAHVIDETIQRINKVAEMVSQSAEAMNQLNRNSESMGQMINVINDIAEQTNLLALNAAIEAARAGEQGRGFAVVADEVRNLARRTQEATHEIQDLIGQFQQSTKNASSAMQAGNQQAAQSAEQTSMATQSLIAISDAVGEISSFSAQIATATEEQTAMSAEISQNVAKISESSGELTNLANETRDNAREVSEASVTLNKVVASFET